MSGGGGGPIIIDSLEQAIGVSAEERVELRRIKDSIQRGKRQFKDRLFVCRLVWKILKQ